MKRSHRGKANAARSALLVGALFASGCYSGPAPFEGVDAGVDEASDAPIEAAACVRMPLPDCPMTPPSYAQTVSQVIANKCVGCHFAGSTIAREDLSTYQGVYANRGTALDQVYGCIMPPVTSVQLTADEKATLITWFECQAPNN